MKFALISLGGKSSLRVVEEAKTFFEVSDHLDLSEIEVRADSKELKVLHKDKPIGPYDCIYIRGSFRYALLQQSITRALHNEVYMPLKPNSFTLGHNKFLTLLELQKNKVPLPTTYFVNNVNTAKKILEKVNFPIIMKIPSGTQGKGVMFADSMGSARSMLDALDVFNQPYIIQEFIDTDSTDIRAIVLGKKVVASMKRKGANGELRANIHAGGEGINFELDYDTEQTAIKAAEAVGAEIAGVDILEYGNKPLVIEVNLSPALEGGISKATKKNVAYETAKFLFEKTKEFKEKNSKSHTENLLREIGSANSDKKEFLTNLNIKAGIIKLPDIITEISEFHPDDEVLIELKKGEIKIKKQEIKKND